MLQYWHTLNLSYRDIWRDFIHHSYQIKQQVFSKCLLEQKACWFSIKRFLLSSVQEGDGTSSTCQQTGQERSHLFSHFSNQQQEAFGLQAIKRIMTEQQSCYLERIWCLPVQALGWQPGYFFLFLFLPVVQTSGSVSPQCLVYLDRKMCKTQTLYLLYNINTTVAEISAAPTHNWLLSTMSEGTESHNTIWIYKPETDRNQILHI